MIELTTIKERSLYNLAGLPINPVAQRLGFANRDRYRAERDRSLAIIKGKTNLIRAQSEYSLSYQSTPQPLVIHYRDYLIAKAIEASLVDVQTLPSGTLTPHAQKVWAKYQFDDLWDYLPPNSNPTYPDYWGYLGTPANYSYYIEPTDLIGTLKGIYVWFWASLGISIKKSPSDRLAALINYIGLDAALLEYLSNVELTDKAKYLLRRAGLFNRPTGLKQLFLLGDYDDYYFTNLLAGAPAQIQDAYQRLTNNTLSMAKPCGMRMVAQMFVVEGYMRAAELLTELPPKVHHMSLQDYLAAKEDMDIKLLVAECFALIADAYVIQHWFSNPHPDLSNLQLWLKSSGQSNVPKDSSYRLTVFA